MARTIAIANQKGGASKTTTAIHLGVAFADLGLNVLLIDVDPQGHLADGFGIIADNLETEMSDVFDGSKDIASVIIPQVRCNLDLAPSNIRLSDMELTLVNLRFRESKLERALRPIQDRYDIILIDCPPSLGLLTVNALIAANDVLIPMSAEYYSMLGVSLLINTIDTISREANHDLAIIGIIPTRQKRTVHSREVVAQTRAEIGARVRIFQPVNETTRFPEAAGQGKTIYDIAPENPGAVAYRAIAEEIIND